MSQSRLLFGLGLALAAASALAASPVGAWKGKINMKMPATAAANPQQKAMMQKIMAQFDKTRVLLNLKADHTFSVGMTGTPANVPQNTSTGKWTQKGNVITMTETKPGARPQTLMLSPDGKSMSLTAPNGQGSVTFTR